MISRSDVCHAVSKTLVDAQRALKAKHAVIGMDGFVDSIIDVVDQRGGFDQYTRIGTIDVLGHKIVAAAGKSANYEMVVKQRKLGGNGPIMANALAVAGLSIDYIGSLGVPTPDPVFADFATRARLHSLCEPGFTDALEFTDGKLMFGKLTQLSQVNWESLLRHVGLEAFIGMCESADLIAMNNWTMLPLLGEIWQHVLGDILPKLSQRPRMLYIDLADPEKRPPKDLREAMATLSQMAAFTGVTLGLNLKEAAQVAGVLELRPAADEPDQIQQLAQEIRQKMGISTVVIHPRGGAAGADSEGTAWFDGPYVQHPKLSTGAGDNFNAGYCLGQLAGCDLRQSLCCGVATSGYYVRNAASPTTSQLAEFVKELPPPEQQAAAATT